ncbi:MAG: ammonium transporter [Solirubrobacteraceae bacterium]|nr:ammonium transporter [Solirubrobacteraceae bacterium]
MLPIPRTARGGAIAADAVPTPAATGGPDHHRRARRARRHRIAGVAGVAAAATLLVPGSALAVDPTTVDQSTLLESVVGLADEVNLFWLIFGTALVFFMQVGFLGLELGFSRGKSVGAGVAKILVNLSVASIAWWAVGFGVAFGGNGDDGVGSTLIGSSGFFFNNGTDLAGTSSGATEATTFIFQFTFAAVSLAIVWGATLERIKFIAYPIFGFVFVALIYPLVVHAGWGGGIFNDIGPGHLDFAGSTLVHLTGATAALAAAIVLGPRLGKYGPDGKPRAIPGHSMPIFGIGVLVLWLGWFGFNGASTGSTDGSGFSHVIAVTNLAAAAGVAGAAITSKLVLKSFDVGMIGNGAIAGLVAITAPAGFVELWTAPIIGLVGGVVVVLGVLAFDRLKIDDPVGATSAHGLAGIWGTLVTAVFASPRLVDEAQQGLWYGGSFDLMLTQIVSVLITIAFVFAASYAVFKIIDLTVGLRVSEEQELAGLDISEHGMYGYPEQFIPEAELIGSAK